MVKNSKGIYNTNIHYRTMSTIVTARDIQVSFDGEIALKNVSFELEEGDSLAIIGPNGAGKSILLKTLLGMIPHQGLITWRSGIRIGYVPQKIDADRHLPITITNLLAAKAAALSLSPKDISEAIASVGLDKRILETSIGHLSGGQFQRALIAFALLGRPQVLILDEPTASIDKPGEEQMYELIHRLQDEYHMTIILVSHDLSFVYRYATKVLCINREGICFGKPEQALTPEVLQNLYGGPTKFFHHIHPHEH
jgi:zinc transport system ATP-binding protein